jgi:hypothetical protein
MSDFRIFIGPNTTGPLSEVGSMKAMTVQFHLDQGDQIQFDVSKYDDAVFNLAELETDVWLYQFGVLRQRFRVVSIDAAWQADDDDALTVSAVSYKRILAGRHLMTDLTYTAIDQAQILWALIQHTQGQTGGALGITAGSLAAGSPRDRTYVAGENILKLGQDLSGVIGGPVWTIDANRVLDVALASSFPTQATPLVMGVTARSLSRKSGAGDFANVGFADGDHSVTVPSIYADPNLATDTRGRWEIVQGFPSVVLQDTLDEKAQGIVEAALSPIAEWTAELEPSRYVSDMAIVPGDFLILEWPCNRFTVAGYSGSVQTQVVSIDVNYTADDQLQIVTQLVEIGDAP